MPFPTLSVDNDSEGAKYRPYINTGGPLDIVNGKFISSVSGSLILSGGLGVSTAFIAEANKYKSTALNGALVNGMARFPESNLYVYDSEYSTVDKNRLANMSTLHLDDAEKREAHMADMKRRMHIFDPATDEGSSLDSWFDFMKKIRDDKVQHAKDWTVETEILDPDTGKPYRMMLPTFISIDSWTEALVRQLNVKNEEFTADTEMKEQRTIYLEEASKKTQLMRQIPSICMKAGIYLGLTGHLGKKFSIDGKPTKKDMSYMGQDQTVKSMSNKFYFLMSSIFENANTEPLVHATDKRQSDYPSASSHIAANELQRIKITLTRSKNAPSGTQTTLVSSQRHGIMAGLSYYDYLRSNKMWNLGSPNKVRSPLLGDLDIGRTKIFDLSSDYKVERALEITYQLFMIQHNWSLVDQVDFSLSLDELIAKLNGTGYAIDDILNSRGWWTYKGAKVDRPYLSLPDILLILTNQYKPKLHPVK